MWTTQTYFMDQPKLDNYFRLIVINSNVNLFMYLIDGIRFSTGKVHGGNWALSNLATDQFSFLGNRARYEFIELDMSTGLDLSIPSSRPLTFPGGQSKNGYRAR